MFSYKCPQKEQSPFNCWLTGPSIVSCISASEEELDNKIMAHLAKLIANGYSKEQLERMQAQGVELHEKERLYQALEFTAVCHLDELIQENVSKQHIYFTVKKMLIKQGPMVVLHPAFGSESVHESALVGVTLAKNSQMDETEVFFLFNETMCGRLTATSLKDMIDTLAYRNEMKSADEEKMHITFMKVPREKNAKPEAFCHAELFQLAGEILQQPSKVTLNLKNDFLSQGYDVIYLPTNTPFNLFSNSSQLCEFCINGQVNPSQNKENKPNCLMM